jgi:hypothetical protein
MDAILAHAFVLRDMFATELATPLEQHTHTKQQQCCCYGYDGYEYRLCHSVGKGTTFFADMQIIWVKSIFLRFYLCMSEIFSTFAR